MANRPTRLELSALWWLAKNALIPATVGLGVMSHQKHSRERQARKAVKERKRRLKDMGFDFTTPASVTAQVLAGEEKTAGVGRSMLKLLKAPVRTAADFGHLLGTTGRLAKSVGTTTVKAPFALTHAAIRAPGIIARYGLPMAALAAPPALLGMYAYNRAHQYGRDPELDAAYEK